MKPKLEICKKCPHFRRHPEGKHLAYCDVKKIGPWLGSIYIGALTNGCRKIELSKDFSVPNTCPFILEHTVTP